MSKRITYKAMLDTEGRARRVPSSRVNLRKANGWELAPKGTKVPTAAAEAKAGAATRADKAKAKAEHKASGDKASTWSRRSEPWTTHNVLDTYGGPVKRGKVVCMVCAKAGALLVDDADHARAAWLGAHHESDVHPAAEAAWHEAKAALAKSYPKGLVLDRTTKHKDPGRPVCPVCEKAKSTVITVKAIG